MKFLTLITVKWEDAYCSTEMLSVENVIANYKPVVITSTGYFIFQSDSYLIMAFSKFNDKVFKHWQIIPNKNIVEIKEKCG